MPFLSKYADTVAYIPEVRLVGLTLPFWSDIPDLINTGWLFNMHERAESQSASLLIAQSEDSMIVLAGIVSWT